MSTTPYTNIIAVSTALGVLSHVLLWIRLELDAISNQLVVLAGLSLFLAPYALNLRGVPTRDAISLSLTANVGFGIGIFSSILVYRGFLHPLKRYPGPILGKLTTFWKVKEFVQSDYQAYRVFDSLHQQYGDVVRLGPRQLSINHAEAYHAVYGVNTECRRLSLMEGLRRNLQSLSNPHEHRARRKIWDYGLNARACQTYLPQINKTSRAFCDALARFDGKPMCVNEWCHFATFDVMGLLGFGQSYGQLQTGKAHPSIAKVQKFLKAGSIALQMLWVVNFVSLFPGLEDPIRDLKEWSQELLDQRARSRVLTKLGDGDGDRDLMSYVEESRKAVDSKWPMTEEDVAEDAALLQVAGSDTSYSVMVNLCHFLANHQALQDRLRHEILPCFSTAGNDPDPSWSTLAQNCPYLDATVNEILRICPPVLQGPLRESPDHPIDVAGHIIPAKTLLSCPIWSIQHDERWFKYADEFIPERWLDSSHMEHRSELIRDKRAFVAFSVGNMNCAGKYFAYMEVKVMVAHLLRRFHITFPSSEGPSARARDRKHLHETKDYLTQWSANVEVCFQQLNVS